MHKPNTHSGKTGFTLAEILMAMMVFAIAISTILALLARSIETADSILIKDEAISLSSSVDSFMSELPFETAYGAVEQEMNFYAYQYRAVKQTDGSLLPYPIVDPAAQLGTDYIVVPNVRPSTDPDLPADLLALEGRLFQVQLKLSDANPVAGPLPADPNADAGGVPAYNSAVVVVYAEFYVVPNETFVVDATASPVFSFNFAVRR